MTTSGDAKSGDAGASGGPAGPGQLERYTLLDAMARRRSIRTVMAYQAHPIDTSFDDRHFRPGAYTQAHADHMTAWRGGPAAPNGPGPAKA